MIQLLQQLTLLASEANETDEQRAQRLSEAADQCGADAETLYQIERDLRTLGRQYEQANEEKIGAVAEQLKPMAAGLGINPDAAGDQFGAETVINVATMKALARPAATAKAVKTLHEAFERRGLYQELGTETPPAGQLEPVMDVEGGPVEEGQ